MLTFIMGKKTRWKSYFDSQSYEDVHNNYPCMVYYCTVGCCLQH